MIRKNIAKASFLILFVLMGACSWNSKTPVVGNTPSPTVIPATVTPTLPPLAARVNDSFILLSDYQAEIARLKAAETQTGITLTDDERRRKVLDELISQEILAQEAVKNGFRLDDAGLEERIAQLKEQAGGEESFNAWMNGNGYDADSLKRMLWKSMAAAFQREKIQDSGSKSVEQVHARQILVFTEELANHIYAQLEAGADFATLCKEYNPVTGGDLGWFPRGYLTQPDIEKAAFELAPGEYSPVIKTSFGYHILQVIERDTARELEPDAKQAYQHNLLNDWIQEEIAKSKIEELAP